MPANKSSINFGMVYIPITYTLLLKNNDINFHLLDKNTLSRIKYKKVTVANEEKEVLNKDIVKGYEYAEDKYVIFDDKDFEKIKTEKDRSITISKFVDLKSIDPIYYDRPYLISPKGGEHAFLLLAKAMENKQKVGVAKTVIGQKETLVIIRSQNNQLYLNTLFFPDMLKEVEKEDKTEKFSQAELDMAEKLIENMSGEFKPEEYKDMYKEKLLLAIDKKIAGQKLRKPKEVKSQKISNLMEALTESIKATNKKRKKK